jgi:L-threonylcarbamoyladenylate synthase
VNDRTRAVPFGTESEIEAALPGIVHHLRAQRVIAYPTETVYGFGSSIMHEAITRVARIKRAAPERSFIALIAGLEMLEALDVRLSGAAAALAAQYWPGPLTLLVENGRRVKTGIRWTPHPGAQRIIRAFGAPITSTSANRSGLPPVTTAEEIVKEWEREMRDGILLVLDGGAPVIGLPSTIVDCTLDAPRVVRSGVIGTDDLRTVVPDIA